MNKIALIFDKRFPDTLGTYVKHALVSLNISFDHICSSEMERLKPGYDLYFRISDGFPERVIPKRLHPSVYWVSDVHIPSSYRHLKNQVAGYDMIFCVLQLGLERLKKYVKKIHFVSVACDPETHQKLNLPKKYDLGYVGTDGGIPRKFILQSLLERYENSFIGRAPFTKISEIYSQSKIGISYPIRLEGMTMRSFEIAACGTLQIMPRLPKPWAEDLGFEDGKNILMFDSFGHLTELIDYYLSHESERETLAQRAKAHVLNKHTYQHKVRDMLSHVQQELHVLGGLAI